MDSLSVSKNGKQEEKDRENDEQEDNLIRIKSHDDGIFETEEDDEDSDFDFSIPEVELLDHSSRKRKQELNSRDEDNDGSPEVIEIIDYDNSVLYREETDELESFLFPGKKKDRTPLYLLNPDDFPDDPRKQIQIRRAIITYRHHQEKKEQIIKLTEENRNLRKHIHDLKEKLCETSTCGCDKNRCVNLDILDVKIPPVPPRVYIRGTRAVLAAPYNKYSVSSTNCMNNATESNNVKTESGVIQASNEGASSSRQETSGKPVPKPLINISPSPLLKVNLNDSVISSKPMLTHCHRMTMNGTSLRASMPRLQSAPPRNVTTVTPSRPEVVMSPRPIAVKTESVVYPNLKPSQGTFQSVSSKYFQRPPQQNSGKSPATAPPMSKMFGNKPVNSFNSTPSVSQILFSGNTNIPNSNFIVQANALERPQLKTASQLAIQNGLLPTNKPRPINPAVVPSSSQCFRTASGQMLKLVSAPSSRPISTMPLLRPIQPKRMENTQASSTSISRTIEEEMWKRFEEEDDDLDEEDLGIIAAVSEINPPSRNRKQTMASRNSSLGESGIKRKVIRAGNSEIEVNKYADIVFEEAN